MTVNDQMKKFERNRERIAEMAETLKRENRARTEAEEQEYRQLVAENQQIKMAVESRDALNPVKANLDLDAMLRQAMSDGSHKFCVKLVRDGSTKNTTADLAGTGVIPVSEQELLKPVRAGLIYDKLGINIRSGLHGTLRWPLHGKLTAYWVAEGEAVNASKIEWDKLEMTGERIAARAEVTREELEDSAGVVESVIREEMPKTIADRINAAMFLTSKTYQDGGSTKTHKVYGPLCDADRVAFASPNGPTRAELLEMKSAVLGSGLDINTGACCWVMSEATKVLLEDTKVDAGSGRFLVENDLLLGYPVFTTNAIGDDIAFGDWSYLAAGFFGTPEMTVDPYTLAHEGTSRFILNYRFGMVALRKEAFVLGVHAEDGD